MFASFAIATLIICAIVSLIYSVTFSLLLFENRRFAKVHAKTEAPAPKYFARANVIVPCKGMEHRLRENLTAFFRQDHPNYEVTFVVESSTDSAVPVIRHLMDENRHIASRICVAGRSDDTGQKVHNLRIATSQISNEIDVLVFADSDACADRSWLRWLTYNLGTPGLGANTGYRWMVPRNNSFCTKIGCAINNSLATMFGRGKHFLVWGGAWAIHRKVFEASGIQQAWHGVLSDDLVASRALHQANLEVRFEPNCVCASHVQFTFPSLLEFMRRQLLIGRVYTPRYWNYAFLLTLVNQIAFWGGLIGGVIGIASGATWGTWLIAGTASLYVTAVVRGMVRQQIGKIFSREWKSCKRARNFDTFACPIVGTFLLCFMATSLCGRKLKWRGVHYRLSAGGQMRLLGRDVDPSLWPLLGKDTQPVDELESVPVSKTRKAA